MRGSGVANSEDGYLREKKQEVVRQSWVVDSPHQVFLLSYMLGRDNAVTVIAQSS